MIASGGRDDVSVGLITEANVSFSSTQRKWILPEIFVLKYEFENAIFVYASLLSLLVGCIQGHTMHHCLISRELATK